MANDKKFCDSAPPEKTAPTHPHGTATLLRPMLLAIVVLAVVNAASATPAADADEVTQLPGYLPPPPLRCMSPPCLTQTNT